MNTQNAGEHTQGEWKAIKPTMPRKEFPYNIEQRGQVLAMIGHIDAEANANLIAAAPDMLKAMKMMQGFINAHAVQYNPDEAPALRQAMIVYEAAIKKATL